MLSVINAMAEFYLRHSALRTIRGGICRDFILRLPGFIQLLLLGYQRTVKSDGFKNNLFFLSFVNIVTCFFSGGLQKLHPPPID